MNTQEMNKQKFNTQEMSYQEWNGLQVISMQNEQMSLKIVPEVGGKIASIYHKEKAFEALFQAPQEYSLAYSGAPFDVYDSSGYDDAFPNVIKEVIKKESGEEVYHDHGDIWSAIFREEVTSEGVKLTYVNTERKYTYIKKISLEDNTVKVAYDITNDGEKPLSYLWLLHMLSRIEEGMYLEVKEDGLTSIENVSDSGVLGEVGDITPYPYVKVENELRHFNTLFETPTECCEKYYFKQPFKEGYAKLVYPKSNASVTLGWDAKQLPYVGVWITQGGYRGDYNCAIEPTTSYHDSMSKALETQTHCVLEKGESTQFELTVTLA